MKKLLIFAILIIVLSGCITKQEAQRSAELNVYNWEDYFGPTTIKDFEKEFNVTVNLFTFSDENFMESDVQSSPDKYDVVIASDALVSEMTALKLLAKIDHNNVPNLKNIGKGFRNLGYDPDNEHSVPYLWGTTGVIINTKYVPEDTDSWSVLWNSKYAGKIAMLNSKEEVISAGLKYLGYSTKTKSLVQLIDAEKALFRQKPLLSGYKDPISIRDDMISEKLWAAQTYSGDAQFAVDKNPNLKYIIPKEGATIWIDNLAIPIDARNKENAEVFINFILRPDVSAKIANYLRYASPNNGAKMLIEKDLLDEPMIYPPDDVLNKLESISVPGEVANTYNKIWSGLQS